LTEIENKTSDIALEFNKVKEHAPDLQTFLSLPHLISKATYEEKNVEKLGSESKLNRKSIIFTARVDAIIKMKFFPLSLKVLYILFFVICKSS
jgi:hypothetical protein